MAIRYEQIQQGEVLEEEKALAEPYKLIEVEERRLLKLENAVMVKKEGDKAKSDIMTLRPEDYGIPSGLLQQVLVKVYSGKLEYVLHEKEMGELIGALDDLNRIINLLREREREWGRVYSKSWEGHIPKEKDKYIPNVDEGEAILRDLGDQILAIENYRNRLMNEIEVIMKQRNPTVSILTGELLGARLIALAGGRERLARLPASTIQILGAENAFFRFRRVGKGMPKHGIIFQHPWVRGSRSRVRGKAARVLAAKIALAARIDYYSGRDEGEALRSIAEERIRKIRMEKKEKDNEGARKDRL